MMGRFVNRRFDSSVMRRFGDDPLATFLFHRHPHRSVSTIASPPNRPSDLAGDDEIPTAVALTDPPGPAGGHPPGRPPGHPPGRKRLGGGPSPGDDPVGDNLARDPLRDQRRRQRETEREQLRTSRFDVVTSLFVALIAFIGIFVAILFVIWITSRWTWEPVAIEPIIEPPAAGRGENAEGTERDFEPPSAEEIQELLEPTLEESIVAITDAVTEVATDVVTDTVSDSPANGDSRPPGPEGEGADIVPRGERWQLEWSAKDVDSFARKLDSFGIELGAIGGGVDGLEIVGKLSGGSQKRNNPKPSSEPRLYFQFLRPTPLKDYMQTLMARGGARVGLANQRLLMFLPEPMENQLARLELDYAKKNGHELVQEIGKTIFELVEDDGKYSFVVTSQRYRKPRW